MYALYLRRLRKLDRDWQAARKRLQQVRVLVESLPADRAELAPDLSNLEAVEAAARERYEEHAGQEPELSREYADRAELAEVTMDARRKEHALAMLLTARPSNPGELSRLAAAAAAAVESAEAARAALVTRASEVDAAYQSAVDDPEPNWLAIDRLHAQAEALRASIGKCEARLATAQRRHHEATERHEAREAMARRRITDAALARAELDRVRAYADELRARLPATVSAPLREPRHRAYGAPADPSLHPLIRERYRYEPATETLHKLPHGELVKATSTIMIDGQRIPRAAVIGVLAPPAFNPEDLA
jgi:chromosome segregation ATPase